MNRILQIMKEIREGDYSVFDLDILLTEIKSIRVKKQAQASIKEKKSEIENLEKRISDINAGNYKEEEVNEEDSNYYY